jgi:hypothetical protein
MGSLPQAATNPVSTSAHSACSAVHSPGGSEKGQRLTGAAPNGVFVPLTDPFCYLNWFAHRTIRTVRRGLQTRQQGARE